MYGILLESLMESIKSEYGQEMWDMIQDYCNIDESNILTHNTYPDMLFEKIVETLMMYRQEGDHEYYMEFFGRQFVSFFSNYGFEKILRVAGRSFRDFLHSIDQLHESNRFSFPKMSSPLFFVSVEDPYGLSLHYKSRRRGFNFYVVGQLKECARRFFRMQISVRITDDFSDSEFNHVVFRIDFDNSEYILHESTKVNFVKEDSPLYQVMPDVMLHLFPFSFGFDQNFKIRYLGSAFENLFSQDLVGLSLFKVFKLVRPTTDIDWNAILVHSSVVFELENRISLRYAVSADTKVLLKGQMKYFKEFKQMLFLGHPVLTRMEQLHEIGLYLNDLNKFDGSAEMLVTELQHNDQLQKAFQAQQAFFRQLQSTRSELGVWRRKGKRLLYSMLPAKIAKKIENGVEPNTICETFEEVTIMFANTADFKTIIKNPAIEPIQVIEFVNQAIFVYDRVVSSYPEVHKIETKADGSYMVVAGIDSSERPSSRHSHADTNFSHSLSQSHASSMISLRTFDDHDENSRASNNKNVPDYNQVEVVSAVALEIVESCTEFENPFDKTSKLKVQIGIHTGPVVAGIVGLSNIQFCMFGDTVNTSSRMCSNSEPGRVLISESSHVFLSNSKYFNTEYRDKIKVKGKGMMDVYWLVGKKPSEPSTPN